MLADIVAHASTLSSITGGEYAKALFDRLVSASEAPTLLILQT